MINFDTGMFNKVLVVALIIAGLVTQVFYRGGIDFATTFFGVMLGLVGMMVIICITAGIVCGLGPADTREKEDLLETSMKWGCIVGGVIFVLSSLFLKIT